MGLEDLLVSYKQVVVPRTSEQVVLPTTRFDNMVNYIEQRDEAVEQGTTPPFKWMYKTKEPERAQTNNTPIMSRNEWVNQLAQAYRDLQVSENGIRNLIAKNALESGWGQNAQGTFNYGNITTGSSWTGAHVNGRDHDANGNPIRNKFRSYDSIQQFAADEIALLKRLYNFNQDDDIDTFLSKLQGGNSGGYRYAADPDYKTNVKKVYKSLS